MKNGNVTLKDVAKRAGVSIATVSRVLNGTSSVKPEIEHLVRETVEELGYVQNSVARSLKTNSTYTIAFVTFDIANPYTIAVARGIEELVRKEKYNLLVCSTAGYQKRELEYLQMLLGRNIDGLILHGTGFNREFLETINQRIPIVLLHRRYSLPMADLVDSDNEGGMYQLTKYLTSFGHKKIFLIKGDPTVSNSAERFRGFCRAMQESGITVDEHYPFQFDGDFTERSGYQAIEYMRGLDEKPTAVLSFNNSMTLGALECMRISNITVPEDLSVASYNNIEYKNLMMVRPTTYNINPYDIGAAVGKAILDRIKDRTLPNREFIVKGTIEQGNAVNSANV